MDQRAHDVEEDLKNILQTRMALGDKIQTLERHIEASVESTKQAALDALDLARDRAAGFIESTSNRLNPSVQAGRRPWIMVGSAIAVGFFAGVIEQRRRRGGVYRYYPRAAGAADVMPEDGRSREPKGVYPFYGREQARPAGGRWAGDVSSDDDFEESQSRTALSDMWKPLRSLWDDMTREVASERDRLQETVLVAGRSLIHDLVRLAGQSLLDQLSRPGGPGVSRQGQRRTPYE